MSSATLQADGGCSAAHVDVDARAQAIAETQHGYLTGSQAGSCGMTGKQLRHRRESGGWVKVLPDVYRLPGVPETFEGKLMAVQLWMGEDGFFWGPTAGYLFGLDGIEKPEPIEVARFSGADHPSLKVRRISRTRPRAYVGTEVSERARWSGSFSTLRPFCPSGPRGEHSTMRFAADSPRLPG